MLRWVVDVRAIAVALGIAGSLVAAPAADAAPKRASTSAATEYNPRYAAIVIEADTGLVLHAVDADQPSYPASLTKMMTLYMAFEALAQRRIQLEHRLAVSEHAASMSPSKLGLRPGSSIRVEDAILAMVTKSANDAAVVLAEGLGGSEDRFAELMTQRARRLGMTRTNFENASGLPNMNQLSTARDMAILGRALIRDFPQYYPYFATRSFVFQGHVQANHNRLLDSYDGADGIKTGFIRASGFNLVASAKRNGKRLIGVVFGGQSQPWRDAQMARLLDQGFARQPGEVATATISDQYLSDTDPSPRPKLVRLALGEDSAGATKPRGTATMRSVALAMPASPAPSPVATTAPVTVSGARPPAARPAAAPSAPAAGGWIVQVGAFSGQAQAAAASKTAIRTANLQQGQVSVSPAASGRAKLYRARVTGLAEGQARDACKTLTRQHMTCVVLGPGAAQSH